MAARKQKVNKDSRAQLIHTAVLNRIKSEYGFTQNLKTRDELYTLVTDSVFVGKWDPSKALEKHETLFKIGNSTYSQKEFAAYINSKQKKNEKREIHSYVDLMYDEFVDESLIKYENALLEEKYPEFKALMKEYRDGILLFDLTDQNVWSKAVRDTAGLQAFYTATKNNYMWGQRVEASIYTVKTPAAAQKVKNFIKSGLKDEDILKEINSDSAKLLKIESAKYSRKDNHFIDTVTWTPGISKDIQVKDGIVFINIKRVIKPEPKQLNEARGLITADYQNYLEKEWIRYLRSRYPVVVSKEVYAKIK